MLTTRKTIPKWIAVTGGKGGVGKSNLALNFSLALMELGEKVCLIDADFGLANLDVLLGIKPMFHWGHVLSGQKTLEEIVLEGPKGLCWIPACSGFKSMARLPEDALQFFVQEAEKLTHRFDRVILDTAAGISPDVLTLLYASQKIIVVLTPEPTSMTDSYALIKALKMENAEGELYLLLNQCRHEDEGKKVALRLQRICTHFLGKTPELLGVLIQDEKVSLAVRQQKAFLELYPDSTPSKQIRTMAHHWNQKK
jgi:flagellar biosynthesis protein FlhG